MKYDNQRLDYYQPTYTSFNYLPTSPINYPASLSNFNVMNTPLVESSSLQRPVISLPNLKSQQRNLQAPSNLQSLSSNNMPSISFPANMQNNLPNNLMTAESINSQQFSVLPPQLPPSIQHLSPEFMYDYGQKPNSYSLDNLRNLNGLSLSSLTPLLLLSSLGTLSSKSALVHSSPLTPAVSTSFIKSLTSYLSSYLPSSPRHQRNSELKKRQIDRNLPLNAYSLKKSITPFDPFTTIQTLTPLSSQINPSIYETNFKKHLHFNKKKPVKYIKPKWIKDNKKQFNLKKQNKNQIKYSSLINESGFINKQQQIQTIDRTQQQQLNKFNNSNNQKRPQQQNQQPKSNQDIKYSEPDSFLNKQKTNEETNKDEINESNKESLPKSLSNQENQITSSRSTNDQQNDKPNEKVNDNVKLNEETNGTEQEGHHSIELTSNPPASEALEDIAEKLYR